GGGWGPAPGPRNRAPPRPGPRAGGEPLAPRALAQGAAQLVLDLAEPLDVASHPQGEAEDVLGPQEERGARVPRPLTAEGAREGARPGEGGIALEVTAPRGHRPYPGGQPLEQGRLAAAVLPHQERHARAEVEPVERAEERHRERKAIGVRAGARAADPGEEDPRRGRPAGARSLHALGGLPTSGAPGSPRAAARRGPPAARCRRRCGTP